MPLPGGANKAQISFTLIWPLCAHELMNYYCVYSS
uniref:Uncharacterized protein n=1 Tax=Anguilla anguilla TaxID=7936 RepID=A0A0E9XW78_ANGAN